MKPQGRLFSVFIFLLLISFNHNAAAREAPSVQHFVEGCSELVGIYESRSKQRLLAAQTTSLSEALRAGYCRGVIEQYQQQHRSSCNVTWFDIAEYVSQQEKFASKYSSVTKLLEIGCQ